MASDWIRHSVALGREIIQLGDKELATLETDEVFQQLVEILSRKVDKNPNTVAMILLHLEQHGFQLNLLDTELGCILMQKKRQILNRLSVQDLSSISENARGMFGQPNRLCN